MIENPNARARAYVQLPKSALARAGLALLAFALLVLAFFFVAVMVVVGGVVAAVGLARWWWLSRKTAAVAARNDGAIEGEYTVIRHTERVRFDDPGER